MVATQVVLVDAIIIADVTTTAAAKINALGGKYSKIKIAALDVATNAVILAAIN